MVVVKDFVRADFVIIYWELRNVMHFWFRKTNKRNVVKAPLEGISHALTISICVILRNIIVSFWKTTLR